MPGAVSAQQSPATRHKKPISSLAIIGVTLGGILLAAIVAYKFVLGSGTKKHAAVVSDTAIRQHIVPWPDKAEAAVRRLLSGSSGANVGRSIQTLAHPTGKSGAIANVEIRHMGDQLR
jgi:flagellar basal body-associated protein FliL